MSVGFSLPRARAVAWKEWRELLANRSVLTSAVLVPLIFTVIAILSVASVARLPASEFEHARNLPDIAGAAGAQQTLLAMILRQLMTVFLIIPSAMPSVIAATSVVNEKVSRSLEAVLATPVRTTELLAGKLAACVLLGVAPAYLAYLVFLAASAALIPREAVPVLLAAPVITMVLVLGPLMATFSTTVTLMVSSRAETVQAAQSVSGLLVLPLVGVGVAQAAGKLTVSVPAVLVAALSLAGLCAGALALCASLFERETILTRWK